MMIWLIYVDGTPPISPNTSFEKVDIHSYEW